jgi:hypothetical protein
MFDRRASSGEYIRSQRCQDFCLSAGVPEVKVSRAFHLGEESWASTWPGIVRVDEVCSYVTKDRVAQ